MSERPPSFEHDQQRMRAYLLGELPAEESADVETRVFDNDADYERLLDAQYDLLDAYARGTLSASERLAVEQRLLAHPEGRRRALLAKTLSASEGRASFAASEPRGRSASSRLVWLPAAAIFVLASTGGLIWMGFENARLRRELDARVLVSPASAIVATASPVPAVAELLLSPRVLRGDQSARVAEIPSSAGLVRVRLPLDETALSLVVGVERAGAGRVWTQNHTGPKEDGAIIVWLPAETLQSGDYEILLWREREGPASLVAAYPFRVVRR